MSTAQALQCSGNQALQSLAATGFYCDLILVILVCLNLFIKKNRIQSWWLWLELRSCPVKHYTKYTEGQSSKEHNIRQKKKRSEISCFSSRSRKIIFSHYSYGTWLHVAVPIELFTYNYLQCNLFLFKYASFF